MAIDLLALSPTYVARTDEVIRRRRAIVAEHLGEEFGLSRKVSPDLLARLKKEGAKGNIRATLNADVTLYRYAFRWLTGTVNQRQTLEAYAKANRPGSVGIKMLRADGILTWDDALVRASRNTKEAEAVQAPVGVAATVMVEETEPTPDVADEYTQAATALAFAIGNFVAISAKVAEELKSKRTEVLVATETAEEGKRALGLLADELAGFRAELAAKDAANSAVVEGLRVQLERQTGQMQTHRLLMLQQLAAEMPESPELYKVVQSLSGGKDLRADKLEPVPTELPQQSKFHKVEVEYRSVFLAGYKHLSRDTREEIGSVVRTITETSGVAFRTSPMPGEQNKGLLLTRAGKKFGLVWGKTVERITFYWVQNKKGEKLGNGH